MSLHYGESYGVLAYGACADTIPALQQLASKDRDVDFRPMHSLYYASQRCDVSVLQDELTLRERDGFGVSWLAADELQADCGSHEPGAVLSQLAAWIDPHQMAYSLFTAWPKAAPAYSITPRSSASPPPDAA